MSVCRAASVEQQIVAVRPKFTAIFIFRENNIQCFVQTPENRGARLSAGR